nr:multidrug efflux SMR transporter [Micromonospora sp. HNM0581]
MLLAIAAEVTGTSLLKATQGFTRLWPTLGLAVAYLAAFALLAQAVKGIPVGVAYAMWSGLGTAAIVAIGAAYLGEPLTLVKGCGVGLVIAGVVLLNLDGAH